VDSVPEGIYQREPGVIRVNVQLVDGRSGATKWAQRYDLRSSNILSFEDQIATKSWMASKCESQPPNRKRFSNPQPQVRRRTIIICKHVFTGTSISYIPTREVSIKAKSFWCARELSTLILPTRMLSWRIFTPGMPPISWRIREKTSNTVRSPHSMLCASPPVFESDTTPFRSR
jgi:hypothetical protein